MDFEEIMNTFQYNGKFRREIHNFCQKDTEIVFEAWERFKEIVKCQHSGIELWMQLQDFWDGLTPASRRTLSNADGGPLMKNTLEEIVTILNELSEDANQWPSESVKRRRSTGVHQVDATHQCRRGHPTHECQASTKEVNVVGNYNFNAMGQRYLGFSWSSPGEDLVKAFIIKTDESLDAHRASIKELGTGFRNLERQVGQIAIILSERVPGTLPADTERNPKETVNVVTLRSGQVLRDPTPIQKEVKLEKENEEQLKNDIEKKKNGKKGADKKKKEETSRRDESTESEHMPALPFSQKLYREKMDKQFERFLDMLKQVNVNLPFTKVLSQMLAYAKFFKEILTKKRKKEETSVETGEEDWRDKVSANIFVAARPDDSDTRGDSGRCLSSGR
ncbi:uncharacterized protein [Nicotiana tomentosiformis]|uniref:uncharacterized protein n=1 Tax=Nicotiana tomentosiformis TaxID=4098 RepID=UPI00388CD655